MQVYTKTNRDKLKILFFFVMVMFIAFLPISSFLFFLKNDAFTGYFPPKFFMSESLADGHLPLWNPYINFGFPQYGDMSGGYWSPITWLIAATVGYTAYSFTIELLVYLVIAGIGMYYLLGNWVQDQKVRMMAGVVFMCCGYHVGHLQHFNWLSGSAFLPWCIWSYLLLVRSPNTKTILLNVLLFYLLFSSAHPGIIIGSLYFFLALACYQLFRKIRQGKHELAKKFLLPHGILILLFALLSIAMLLGYADIIPHFVRGEQNSFVKGSSDASTIQSWISLLLPMSTVKNEAFFISDLSLRDSYIGLAFFIFLITGLLSRKNSWQIFLLATSLFFFLVSVGGFFQEIVYKVFPFMAYVRLMGEFRIFAIIPLIIFAAIQLDGYLKADEKSGTRLKIVFNSFFFILLLLFLWAAYHVFIDKNSVLFRSPAISNPEGSVFLIKNILDNSSLYDCVLMNSLIQVILLLPLKKALKNKNSSLLLKVVLVDMILSCLMMIPFTGAGKASLKQVQQVLNQSPHGIPVPPLQKIRNNDTLLSSQNELVGSWSMFNKQIGNVREVAYPIQLKTMKDFFADSAGNDTNYFDNPFLFVKGRKDTSQVAITSYSPSELKLKIASALPGDILVFQQNYYKHWKVTVNDRPTEIQKEGKTFMSVPLQEGVNTVEFTFNPALIKKAMSFSFIAFIAIIIGLLLLHLRTKSSSPS